MTELTAVERRLTETELDTGRLALTDAERGRLGLPRRSADLRVSTGPGEQFAITWAPCRNELFGSQLRTRLRESGRVGTQICLVRVEDGLALRIGEIARTDTPRRAWWARARASWAATEQSATPDPTRPAGEDHAARFGVGFSESANQRVRDAVREGSWDGPRAVELRLRGELLATRGGFDTLRAVDVAGGATAAQQAAARAVLTRLRGRAILAGDPGEAAAVAGLVVKELSVRGLAPRVLVVCPGPVREHWRRELAERFGETFALGADEPGAGDRLILSHGDAAQRCDDLGDPYDLVVVDAAHRLTDQGGLDTHVGDLVSAAPRALLLTPTPVYRSLLDLRSLVELLRPGTFGGPHGFSDRFVDRSDPRRPLNVTELTTLTGTSLLRLDPPAARAGQPPAARTVAVPLCAAESALHHQVLAVLRDDLGGPGDSRAQRHLASRLAAGPAALSRTARRMAEAEDRPALRSLLADVAQRAADLGPGARARAAVDLVRQWSTGGGRTVVVASHADAAEAIASELSAAGVTAALAHGGRTRPERAEAISALRSGQAGVLVIDDSASLPDLPASAHLLNLDLPWDPTRLEERVARMRASGPDLEVATLIAAGTFEEDLAAVLHDGPVLSAVLTGRSAAVLAELADTDASVAERVAAAVCGADPDRMTERLAELSAQLTAAEQRARAEAVDQLAWWPTRPEPGPSGTLTASHEQVESFVRDFLSLRGARVVREGDQYLSALLPQSLAAALEQPGELPLAFTTEALTRHPHAHLCAVGSEIFALIVEALRAHGTVTGSVPVLPEVGNRSVSVCAPWVTLIGRSMRSRASWSARAAYRVHDADAEGCDRLATVEVGRLPEPDAPDRRRLAAGDVPDAALGALLGELEQAVAQDARAFAAGTGATSVDPAGVATLLRNLEEQASEIEGDDEPARAGRARVTEAIESVRRAAAPGAQPEVRAHLVSVELHAGADLEVVEEWEHAAGGRHALVLPWRGDIDALTHRSAATGLPLAVFALCAAGHPVEAETVRRCRTCAQDSCPVCPPVSQVTACRMCGAAACSACRSEHGHCPSCERPHREPAADTAAERAWRLGNGRRVLVGQRHAVLLDGDERTVVVPDEDLADPGRVAVRGLAARLGLPLGAGLAGAPAGRPESAEPALWSRTESSAWWQADPGGGSELDPQVLAEVPALPGPDVLGESDAGMATTLTRLRAEDPPPAAPRVLRRPLAITRRVRCEPDGLWHEEWWQQDDTAPVLAARAAVQFADIDPQPVGEGRVRLARGSAGQVQVDVEQVHRSFLLRLSDGEHTTTAFVPDAEGSGFAGECAWAAWVHSQGLAPGTLVSVDRAIPQPPPARPEVAERTVVATPVVFDGDTGAPARDEDLALLAVPARTGGPDRPLSAIVPELRESLRRFIPEGRTVAITTAQLIDERWRSAYGTTTRRYAMATAEPLPGTLHPERVFVSTGADLPALPTLGSETDELTVDSRGHLIARQEAVECPVCRELGCSACGSPATLSDCASCGRAACGGCLARAEAVAVTTCARCAESSCSGCARHLPVTSCVLCRREVCARCLAGVACLTCAGLAPSAAAAPTAVPAELHAQGLSVYACSDPDGDRVLLLRGVHRLELAIVVRGHVGTWTSLLTDDPSLLRARLAFAEKAGTGDIDVVLLGAPAATPATDAFVVAKHSTVAPAWTLRRGTTLHAHHGAEPVGEALAAADPDLVDALIESVGALRPAIPARDPDPGDALAFLSRSGLLTSPVEPPMILTAAQVSRHAQVSLDPDGLHEWVAEGSRVTQRRAQWSLGAPDATWSWALDGWHPVPDVVAHCAAFGVRAALLRLGDHAVVAVEHGDRVERHVVNDAPLDPMRLLAGQAALGRRICLGVHALADPERLAWPTVSDATLRERRVARVLTGEADAPAVDEAAGLRVLLAAYAPGEQPRSPALGSPPPTAITDAFARWLAAAPAERLIRSVGLEVVEEWSGPDGESLVARYTVFPGQRQAVLTDAVTGEFAADLGWCRGRHLTRHLWRCRWCEANTCRLCADAVLACRICSLAVCGRCRSTTHPDRCGTCGSLSDIGVLERRRLGLGVLGQSWYAGDDRGHSLVVHRKDAIDVVRMLDGRNVSPTLTAAHRRALAEALGVRVRVE